MEEHVFGPVSSRRLGFSLGVDIIPRKYCSFDCIYCQVGKTTHKEIERQHFDPPDQIVKDVLDKADKTRRVDFISLSGSGEPTLNSDIGWIIKELKHHSSVPLAVITNGSLLWREDVRKDLAEADAVLPSLDATDEATFERINRPDPSLSLEQIIGGIKAFRLGYSGHLWLELMLIDNINSSAQHISDFKRVVNEINADKVHLNTVTRPPLETLAKKVDEASLMSIAQILGNRCEVICPFKGPAQDTEATSWEDSLLDMVRRRPLNFEDVIKVTGVPDADARTRLGRLVECGRINEEYFDGLLFYTANGDDPTSST